MIFGKSTEEHAIKQYATKLPKVLKKNYGGSGLSGYTAGQVTTTAKQLNLNQVHIKYALLLFCGDEVLLNQGYHGDDILEMIAFLGKISSGGNSMAESGAASSGLLGGLYDACGPGDGGGGE